MNDNNTQYYAKSKREDGTQAFVKEHLEEVSEKAGVFGEQIGSRKTAELCGKLHDFGKYSESFKGVLARKCTHIDHAICGAAFLCVFLLMASYRSDRITAWLNPETAENGYQILMGLYAIGSGGIFGKGLGNSLQKLGNMPESQNDMIFSIVCEELGLFGAICLILLFVILIWRMMIIANNSRDLYGALLVVGVMSHVAIQVVLNIAVVTNSIPNTGVTLPFISYGGTSLIFLMGEMGLVLSVSRGIQLESIE